MQEAALGLMRAAATFNPAKGCAFAPYACCLLYTSHLDELTIYRDEEYPGARQGCNFPLTIDSVTVGAIGITGEYQEVCRYGQIIKKMTELMIRENDVLERKKIEDRIRDRFLDDWILSAQDETDSMFVRRANAQRIDLNLPRRVALLRKMCIRDRS